MMANLREAQPQTVEDFDQRRERILREFHSMCEETAQPQIPEQPTDGYEEMQRGIRDLARQQEATRRQQRADRDRIMNGQLDNWVSNHRHTQTRAAPPPQAPRAHQDMYRSLTSNLCEEVLMPSPYQKDIDEMRLEIKKVQDENKMLRDRVERLEAWKEI